ncbi:hypothetical protein STAS_15023 [Striga asiatica]|uniref:Transmembrane protein n=1 Tax=Striga asiatica TaxID=4170 RepID=A0A5A7Q0F8_STRAF|nr:hypothetical protein STAS_15023 [Striga asiatica]
MNKMMTLNSLDEEKQLVKHLAIMDSLLAWGFSGIMQKLVEVEENGGQDKSLLLLFFTFIKFSKKGKAEDVIKPCQLMHGRPTVLNTLSKRRFILFATSEDEQSFSELEEPDDFEPEEEGSLAENNTFGNISFDHAEQARGKPGIISFYESTMKIEEQVPVTSQNNKLLWLVGPTVLVASFVFPSLYLRRILSSIFEDSLVTDFLILFFTEALFYCGVSVFLLLIDRLNRPKKKPKHAEISRDIVPHMGYRVSSVAVLVLSIIIPTMTMGFVWPWTGPAASATLAPYLVGIVVQFAFEQYAKYVDSPSWPAIPIVFQIYRLHQLNRAAQLVTALSFTVRGAEMTPHNVAINGSLSTLLNVLQFLGIISIWSLSSFVMKYLPPATNYQ